MNAARRKEIAKAIDLMKDAAAIIEQARDDEQSSFDNMPESLQAGERGQVIEAAAEALGEVCDQIDEAMHSAEEIVSE